MVRILLTLMFGALLQIWGILSNCFKGFAPKSWFFLFWIFETHMIHFLGMVQALSKSTSQNINFWNCIQKLIRKQPYLSLLLVCSTLPVFQSVYRLFGHHWNWQLICKLHCTALKLEGSVPIYVILHPKTNQKTAISQPDGRK